jgi:hypothetical protein
MSIHRAHSLETITDRDVEVADIWRATGDVCDGYETSEGDLIRRVSTDNGPVAVVIAEAEAEDRGATTYTVMADRAIGGVEMHSDTDLTAARRWAEGYTRRDMGGAASIEVIWHAADGEVIVEWAMHTDDVGEDFSAEVAS